LPSTGQSSGPLVLNACFDEASLLLTIAGKPVELERRPRRLLALLLAQAGETACRFWPDTKPP
jgi:hypothetical protein